MYNAFLRTVLLLFLLLNFDLQNNMQFQKFLSRGFRATLTVQKFKLAQNTQESCILSCLSQIFGLYCCYQQVTCFAKLGYHYWFTINWYLHDTNIVASLDKQR